MRLYKYFPRERLDVLRGGMVRFTQPHLFNDPFELAHTLGSVYGDVEHAPEKLLGGLGGTLGDVVQRMFAEMFRAAGRGVRHYFSERIGVLCLTERPDNLLMWAHYASEHRGFVVEFDSEHEFFDGRESSEDPYRCLRKLRYDDDRPSVAMTEFNAFDGLLLKSREWEHEQEWRMFLPLEDCDDEISLADGTTVHLFTLPPSCMTGVILGARSSQADRWAIAELFANDERYRHMELYEASLDDTRFHLHRKPSPVRYLASAATALEAGRHGRAVREMDRAVELSPDDPVYIRGRAYANFMGQRWEALRPDLETLHELDYEDDWTWLVHSILASREGRWDEALAALDRSVELADEPDPITLYQRASYLRRLGRDAEALDELDRYDALRPEDPDSLRLRARIAAGREDFASALELVREAIGLEEHAVFRGLESHYLLRLDRPEEALRSIQLALEELPDDLEYLDQLVRVHEGLADVEAADRTLGRMLELSPDDPDLWLRRARLRHVSLGRRDQALQDVDRALELDPDRARLYWIRGNLHQQLGNPDAARRDLDELRRRDPELYEELSRPEEGGEE